MNRRIIRFAICWALAIAGCSDAEEEPKPRPPATTMKEAGERLQEFTGGRLRHYSTFDFGRGRDTNQKSAIVAHDQARAVLTRIRGQLGPNLIAYIGTTNWLGKEKHNGAEIVVAEGENQYDILRLAKSDAVNYDMQTDDLIKKLQEYDQQFGIDIYHAETDTIEFDLKKMPTDLIAFGKDVYEFCPDIVDQGPGTVEALVKEIQQRNGVYLWWD